MKHLKLLELDNYMIYGMQHLEELSLDHYEVQPSVNPCTLGQAVPKAIECFTIETSEFIPTIEGAIVHGDEWRDWQIEDLQRFLQDNAFDRMYRVVLAHYTTVRKEYIDVEVLTKHGWEVISGPRENEGVYELENRGRNGNTGA